MDSSFLPLKNADFINKKIFTSKKDVNKVKSRSET